MTVLTIPDFCGRADMATMAIMQLRLVPLMYAKTGAVSLYRLATTA